MKSNAKILLIISSFLTLISGVILIAHVMLKGQVFFGIFVWKSKIIQIPILISLLISLISIFIFVAGIIVAKNKRTRREFKNSPEYKIIVLHNVPMTFIMFGAVVFHSKFIVGQEVWRTWVALGILGICSIWTIALMFKTYSFNGPLIKSGPLVQEETIRKNNGENL